MKIKWFSRVFAFVMVITMLMLSCLSIAALTPTASEVSDTDDRAYAFSFEDGVLTVRVNPDKVYNMIKDGDVSREELKEFIPADILDSIEQDSALTMDDLRSIAAEYITVDDLRSLVDQLPTDIVREYFSLDMLTELQVIDDIIEIIPVDDILASVDADAIKPIVNDEVMDLLLANESFESEFEDVVFSSEVIDALVMGDDPLLTKEVMATVFEGKLDTLVTDAAVEHFLADEAFLNGLFADTDVIDGVLTESVIAQIADAGYLDHLISPKDVLAATDLDDALTALGISTYQLVNDCVDPADYQDIYIAYGDDFTAQELLDGGFVTLEQVISEYDITARELIERDVVETRDIRGFVGDEAIKGVVLNNSEVRDILKTSLDGNTDIDADDYWKYVDVQELVEFIGSGNLAKMIVNDEEILDRFFAEISPIEVFEASGINVVDVIESAGGMKTVFGFYSTDEIKAITDAIDRDALAKFVKDDLFAAVDIKALAQDIIDFVRDRKEDFKEFANVIIEQSTKMLTTEVDYISINGTNFYEHEYAMFDLNTLLEEILSVLPDFDTFMQLGTDAIVASFDAAISVRGTEFALGVELGYLGDPTNLNDFLESKSHLFKLDIADDNTIQIQTSTPDVLSEIYRELLESDTLSVSLRNKLASIPLESLDNAIALLQELSEEERQAIVDDLEGKLDAIRDEAYAKIEAEYGGGPALFSLRNVAAVDTGDEVNSAMSASQDKVDSIVDAFTSAEKLETAVNNMANVVEYGASEQLRRGTLVDFYNQNGNFTAGSAITVDVLELANKVVTVPEEIQLFLMSTEVSVGAAYDITVDGLHGVEVVLEDGSTFKTILPAGTNVAKLQDIPVLEGFAEGLIDANLNSIDYLPENDIKAYSAELYSVQFVANETVLDTILYSYGTDSVAVPVIPEEYEKVGYNVAWESFSLNQIQRLTVELEYTPIQYDATFISHNRTDVVKFTIEDIEDGQFKDAAKIPAVGEKLGYTGVWEEYTLSLEDITINAEYTINIYTATFISYNKTDVVEFTIEDIENGQFKDATKVPTIANKLGYTGVWEAHTLGASDITINAVYTANIYTATFKSHNKTDVVEFTVDDIENGQFKDPTKIPDIADKIGYTGAWEEYTLSLDNITINAVYEAIEYTATFISYNKTDVVKFTVEDIINGKLKDTKVPMLGEKVGYKGVWEDYTVDVTDPDDITIGAEYTAIVYSATFVSYNQTKLVGFTVEDVVNGKLKDSKVPAVGAKVGYDGAWEDYTIDVTAPDHITINAEYTAIVYTATFNSYNKTDRVGFTVEDVVNGKLKDSKVPTVGARVGYNGVWEDYTIDANDPDDITIGAEYTAIVYTATFVSYNQTKLVGFTVEDVINDKLKDAKVPAVGERVGYQGAWKDYTIDVTAPDDIAIEAEYTAIVYTATFVSYNKTDRVGFTVEDVINGKLKDTKVPTVGAKLGYDGAWENYTINVADPDDITIGAEYTAIVYTAAFVSYNKTEFVGFTVEDVINGKLKDSKVPAVGEKVGYDGAWEDYTIDVTNLDDITISAEYTAIVYTATFKSFGKTDTVGFTVEDIVNGKLKDAKVPTVGEKVGYEGTWENYAINVNDPGDITINAKYSTIFYTATFVVDGEEWATVVFTVENASIPEPPIPEKAGFTGAWEEYELIADNITINAIYTAIGGSTTTGPADSDSKPSTTGKPGGTGSSADDDDDEDVTKGPVADIVDDLTEEGTFWWWILLIIAILIIIAIILFLILRPKDDDDDGDNTPPAAPVVEEVVEEVPEIIVPTVDSIDVADADALMSDDVALATLVYKEGGSTEGYKATVNLGAISDVFNDGDKVDLAALKAKGLVPAKTKRVKILASGLLDKHGLEVEANGFSLQAIKMITLTGGTAVQKR